MLSIIASSVAGVITFIVLDYIWLARIVKKTFILKACKSCDCLQGSLVPTFPAVPLVYLVA